MAIRGSNSSDAGSINIKSILLQGFPLIGDDVKDIRNIVTSFTITESLSSPTLLLEMNVKDAVNFMECMGLSGQETITITLAKASPGVEEGEEIEFKFIVTDYPLFGKDSNKNTSVYKIKAISPYAYKSGANKISKGYGYEMGITDEIAQIIDGLGGEFNPLGDNMAVARGVIPWMTPLNACEFLRTYSYDADKSPFYLYQTLDSKINFSSLSYLIGPNPVFQTYFESPAFSGEQGTEELYQESKTRIVSMVSQLNMSKYNQMKVGSFASLYTTIDQSDKSIEEIEYSYQRGPHLNEGLPFDPAFVGSGVPLPDTIFSKLGFVNKNKVMYEDQPGIGEDIYENVQTIPSYLELLENYIVDITLMGDFHLNAGTKIELKILKPGDKNMKKDYNPDDDDTWDTRLSGHYLISSAIHEFKDEKYHTHLRAKKDI